MTSIIGILCTDGVVIGADSSATSISGQTPIMEQKIEKIREINGKLVAQTGSIGLGQRFDSIVRQVDYKKGDPIKYCKNIAARAIEDFQTTGLEPRYRNIGLGVLFAFFDPECDTCKLCEFEIYTFQPELKNEKMWHVSMGSGQAITDPMIALLEGIFWKNTQPNVNEGVFMTLWALQHVIEINPGGINGPPIIVTLQASKSKEPSISWLDEDLLSEHKQNIDECKEALQEVEKKQRTYTINIPKLKENNEIT